MLRLGFFALAGAMLVGCSSASSASGVGAASTTEDAGASGDAGATVDPGPSPLVQARPYALKEPSSYDRSVPAPLVIGLHGYGDGDNADAFEAWLKLAPVAAARGYLYALPSGTLDRMKLPFWNATDACCNFYKSKVDDVAYISAVIDDVARTHALDRARVYVVGVSGGAIMAHRLACDLSDKIAAIFSVSGATYADASKCKPTSPVSVVELHGDADDTVVYDGGTSRETGASYPGARDTIAHWKSYDGCVGELKERKTLDLESSVAGAETHVESYDTCVGGSVELWTAKGGPHAPRFTSSFTGAVFDWLADHPKAK
ncbi:MAG: PHB depolymerase family esterase [Polyangiaceae bacterium]